MEFVVKLKELGVLIAKERKLKPWTQKEMAQYAGINVNTLKKIEAGFEEEVGMLKTVEVLELLGFEILVRPKGRPLTLEELNSGQSY